MPMFTYACSECGYIYEELAKPAEKVPCPSCKTENAPNLPTGIASVVMETRDSYRGKQVKKGNEQQMRDRMVKNHDRYEVAEKVDKYGLDEAKKHGWLKKAKKV